MICICDFLINPRLEVIEENMCFRAPGARMAGGGSRSVQLRLGGRVSAPIAAQDAREAAAIGHSAVAHFARCRGGVGREGWRHATLGRQMGLNST